MKVLSDIKLGQRLGVAFGTLVMLVVAITMVGASRLLALNEHTTYILQDGYAKVRSAEAARSGVSQQARMLTNALIEIGDTDVNAALAKAAKADEEASAAMKTLDGLIHTDDSRAAFDAATKARAKYAQGVASVLKLVADGNTTSGRQTLLDDVVPPLNTYLSALDKLAALQSAGMHDAGTQAGQSARSGIVLLLALGSVCAVFAVAGAWIITRSITQPVGQALAFSASVASGNLTGKLTVTGRDEISMLLRALVNMNDSLAEMVGKVREGSDSIATGSSEIAVGNADLSQRTERQAGSLQQAASSLVEFTHAAKRTAETSKEVNTLAAEAADAAADGSSTVGQVVATMDKIAGSSKRISDITGVIDGIAFQTNILALNAAVEAARAGEQGRGFAVVASEVRSLAQRAASAAKEIKTLIGDSSVHVEDGARLVRGAGDEMQGIVVRIRRVSELIGEISNTTAEQTSRIDRVSETMVELDQVTQQNSALVEQSAAAAESLNSQAQMLTSLVHAFEIA
jgi:methyl-accepting chemotaxis protein